jgi:hypothetical protein
MEGADMTAEKLQDLSPLSANWPTIFEIASTIQEVNLHAPGHKRTGGRGRSVVTKGLTPVPFPIQEGYFPVTPEQVASLKVPRVEVGDTIKGFQRDKINTHARKIARAMLDGKEMPPLMVSIFPDGQVYVDDGQHRAIASIIARKNVEVVVKKRTVDQARQLFADQGRARSLKSDDVLLTGNSAIELYLQDAVTSDNHPWSRLVSPYSHSRGMTPTSMVICVGNYVFNSMTNSTNYIVGRDEKDFNKRQADQLARLIDAFGSRTTNQLAWRSKSLRAITYAAIHVFRRNPDPRSGDEERWLRHMPTFDFAKYPHLLNREIELSLTLLDHWNKRLPAERKVQAITLR